MDIEQTKKNPTLPQELAKQGIFDYQFTEADVQPAKLSAYKEDGTLTKDAQTLAKKGAAMPTKETWAAIKTTIQERRRQRALEAIKKDSTEIGYREAASIYIELNPTYYDKQRNWWVWNDEIKRWEKDDETTILKHTEDCLGKKDYTIKNKRFILEALQQESRFNIPEPLPDTWIQFEDTLIDFTNQKEYPSTPAWFTVNPLPYKPGPTEDTPTMDKLFTEWVGEKYVKTLYEVLAYCCYRKYPIHVAIALVGSGRNGKSSFLKVLTKFLGQENCADSNIHQMSTDKFEIFNIYQKLACIMGETNFKVLEDSQTFKKITSGDLVSFQAKHKGSFSDYSYATVVIASNSLPISADTSDGWYRRWLRIKFPNEFPEGPDPTENIPEEEYHALSRKVIYILPKLLEKKTFTNQGTIEERKQMYISDSNPLMEFIQSCCNTSDQNGYVRYSEMYMRYCEYLKSKKKRRVSHKEFTSVLQDEGFEIIKTTKPDLKTGEYINGRFVYGIVGFYDAYDVCPRIQESFPVRKGTKLEKGITVTNVTNLHQARKSCQEITTLVPKDNAHFIENTIPEEFINRLMRDGDLAKTNNKTYKVVRNVKD